MKNQIHWKKYLLLCSYLILCGIFFPLQAEKIPLTADPFLLSQLLLPEHRKHLLESESLYLNPNLRLGLSTRFRFEERLNNQFLNKNQDFMNVVGQTSQLWLVASPLNQLAIKLTIQDNRLWGGNPHPSGEIGNLALTAPNTEPARYYPEMRELFLFYQLNHWQIILGRQVFLYGDGRLVGGRNWLHGGNSFDALRLHHTNNKNFFDLFVTYLSEDHNLPNQLFSTSALKPQDDKDALFFGNYNSYYWLDHTFDFYFFGLTRRHQLNVPNMSTNEVVFDRLFTVGYRLAYRSAPLNGIDYTTEFTFQFGKTGQREILGYDINLNPVFGQEQVYEAFQVVVLAGYTFPVKIRFGLQALYSSGDPNNYDKKATRFNPLFGNRHGLYPLWNLYAGEADLASTRNMFLFSMPLIWFTKVGNFYITWHHFYKAESQDDWYLASGIPSGLTREGKLVYRELDTSWHYYTGSFLSFSFGYTVIHAGEAIKNYRKDSFSPLGHFFYLMTTVSI